PGVQAVSGDARGALGRAGFHHAHVHPAAARARSAAARVLGQPAQEVRGRGMSAIPPPRFGRFEVVDILGRGAMGVVYRARDSALGRTVAIKTIALAGDSKERDTHEARFMQEARAAGSLSHPAIVTIYD